MYYRVSGFYRNVSQHQLAGAVQNCSKEGYCSYVDTIRATRVVELFRLYLDMGPVHNPAGVPRCWPPAPAQCRRRGQLVFRGEDPHAVHTCTVVVASGVPGFAR